MANYDPSSWQKYMVAPCFFPPSFLIARGQCFSLQGVIYVIFGKKNETSTTGWCRQEVEKKLIPFFMAFNGKSYITLKL